MFEPIVTGVPAVPRSAWAAKARALAGEGHAALPAPPARRQPGANAWNFDRPAAVSLLAAVPQTLRQDRAEIEAPLAGARREREAWWTVSPATCRLVPGRTS